MADSNNIDTQRHETNIGLDIYSTIGIDKEAKLLIVKTLAEIWPERYEDLDIVEYINIIVDVWINCYIDVSATKEAIKKIKAADPPENLDIRLIFNLLDEEDNLIIECSKVPSLPVFAVTLPTSTSDLWSVYVYNPEVNEFESLEMIEPESINEIKKSMSEKEKTEFDELILQTYTFHEKLLG